MYAQPESERCLVKLLDMYIPKLPQECAFFFYARPLAKFSSDPKKPSFAKQRLGVNALKKIILDLSTKSGTDVHYTNHSLRATAITRKFNAGIPEKVIAENSGHKSLKALHCYEHTSSEQQKAVNKVVTELLDFVEMDLVQKNVFYCWTSCQSVQLGLSVFHFWNFCCLWVPLSPL